MCKCETESVMTRIHRECKQVSKEQQNWDEVCPLKMVGRQSVFGNEGVRNAVALCGRSMQSKNNQRVNISDSKCWVDNWQMHISEHVGAAYTKELKKAPSVLNCGWYIGNTCGCSSYTKGEVSSHTCGCSSHTNSEGNRLLPHQPSSCHYSNSSWKCDTCSPTPAPAPVPCPCHVPAPPPAECQLERWTRAVPGARRGDVTRNSS